MRVQWAWCVVVCFVAASALRVAAQPTDWATRADRLAAKVSALPAATPEQARTKAVLSVAIEQARSLGGVGHVAVAGEWLGDVESSLGRSLGRQVLEQPFLLPFSREPEVIAAFEQGVTETLATADAPLPPPTAEKSSFADVNASRNNGDHVYAFFLAGTHPQSRFKDDAELFTRALRRIAAYIDSQSIATGDKNLDEFFTMDRNYFAIYCFGQVYPDALLPSQKKRLAEGIRLRARPIEERFAKGELVNWCNADMSYASALIHGGMLSSQGRLVDIGKAVLRTHVSEQFADGGFQYIRGQNECVGYHHVMPRVMHRVWLTTRDETSLKGILQSRHYTPLSVEPPIVGSFYMSPAWKTLWNTSYATSPEAAFHTRDPMLKTYQLVRRAYAPATRKKGEIPAHEVMLDLGEVKATPLPDGYTVYDANLQGPRGRHGRFSFAATGRAVHDPVGLWTLVGAIAVDEFDPKRPLPLNASVGPVTAGPTMDTSGRWQSNATVLDEIRATTLLGREFAAITGSYQLSGQNVGPRKVPTSWTGSQQWVLLPDRIVGMVSVSAGDEPAASVFGRVRLHAGAMGVRYPKQLQTIDAENYRYGDLAVRVHGHNFGRLDTEANTPLAREGRNFGTDLRFTDPQSLAAASAGTRKYTGTLYYLVEIRHASAASPATVQRIDSDGLLGVRVTHGGRTYLSVMNATPAAITVVPKQLLDGPSVVIREFKPGDANAPASLDTTALAPGKGLLIVSGTPADVGSPWPSFAEMLEAYGAGNSGLKAYDLPGLVYR